MSFDPEIGDYGRLLTPTRRGLLRAGAATSLLPMTAAVGWASPAAAATAGVYKVIYDPRFAASRDFGQAAASAGFATAAVGGDVTDLWYNDLHHRWREGPVAIAGLTTLSAAFCLEGLGADVWMRTVYRGHHRPNADGGYDHALDGQDAVTAQAHLLDLGADWGVGMARLMSGAVVRHDPSAATPLTLAAAPHVGADAREPLVSWLIAPIRRG